MIKPLFASAFAVGVAAVTPASSATMFNHIVNDFNLVVFEDLDINSDVEGRTIVYGDVTGNSANFVLGGPGLELPGASNIDGVDADDGLFVGGALSGSPKNINNGYDLVLGPDADKEAIVNFNAGPSGERGRMEEKELPELQEHIKQASRYFSEGLDAIAVTPSAQNQMTFSGAPAFQNTAVFDIDAADLSANTSFVFDTALADSFIINVAGEQIDWKTNPPPGLGRDFGEQVIWNFFEAEEIYASTGIFGTVLAPYAFVEFFTPIEGTLIARNVVQRSEVHLEPYAALTPVPLPGAFGLFAAAMGVMALVARRRT